MKSLALHGTLKLLVRLSLLTGPVRMSGFPVSPLLQLIEMNICA